MKLLIVVVNYNGLSLTRDCLASLVPEMPRLPGARIGLCDNGSGEGEADRLRDCVANLDLSDVTDLTVLQPNRGFTGGNNAVIRKALKDDPPEYVFLLNNDTIVQANAIQCLLDFMDSQPNVGLCGSRLEHRSGESQLAARRLLTPINEFESQARLGLLTRLLSRWIVAPPERDEPHETGWVPGAALMIRREVIEEIGLLDEDLYTYFDDVDICLRARRKNWPTWYVPQSRIIHLVGKTTGVTEASDRPKRRPSYWFMARRHYFLKNFGPLRAAMADVAAILGQALWKFRCVIQRRPNNDARFILWDYMRHSVFATGFQLRPVPNPAMQPNQQEHQPSKRPAPIRTS